MFFDVGKVRVVGYERKDMRVEIGERYLHASRRHDHVVEERLFVVVIS